MSKQILIELVGENETGYCYADLYLPASAEEIAEAKERANWNSDSNGIRDISIEHCSTLPKLASFRLDSPTLDELNFLAQRLDAMDGGERTIMNGVLHLHRPQELLCLCRVCRTGIRSADYQPCGGR